MSDKQHRLKEIQEHLDRELITREEFDQLKTDIFATGAKPQPPPPPPDERQKFGGDTLMDLFEGQIIGPEEHHFKLVSEIGGGAMGRIWKAHDQADESLLGGTHYKAVKVVAPELIHAPRALANLKREAIAAAKLSHPNIINVHGWQQGRDRWAFVVMEYLQGRDLDRLLWEWTEQGRNGCTVEEMLQLIQPIATALDYAHSQHKLIHRDLKPANVYLTDKGEIKVIDFGIADELRHTAASYGSKTDLPQKKRSSGTPAYMSPEASCAYRPPAGHLRTRLYQLRTAHPPRRLPYRRRESSLQRATARKTPTTHRAAWGVMQQGFAYDIKARPESAGAYYRALSQALAEEQPAPQKETAAKEKSAEKPPNRKPYWLIAAVVVIGIGTLIALPAIQTSPKEHPATADVLQDLASKQQQLEQERQAIKVEAARIAKVKTEQEEKTRAAQEKLKAETAQLAQERQEQEKKTKAYQAKLAADAKQRAAEKVKADEAEKQRLAKIAQAKAEQERIAREKQARQEKQRQVALQAQQQQKAAEAKKREQAKVRKSTTDPIPGMVFIDIPGGEYTMGGNEYDDEKPSHKVTIKSFKLGKYEVTQGEWKKVMGENPSSFQKGDNYPVESVSWDAVQQFIKKLNQQSGKNYRLPTEAEWEYAAGSGGKAEKYAGTSNQEQLYRYSNFL